ncbi:hypothetical protein ACSVDA_12860 [Cytobacillus sp. Hm23]
MKDNRKLILSADKPCRFATLRLIMSDEQTYFSVRRLSFNRNGEEFTLFEIVHNQGGTASITLVPAFGMGVFYIFEAVFAWIVAFRISY